jgi:hypothetical protein
MAAVTRAVPNILLATMICLAGGACGSKSVENPDGPPSDGAMVDANTTMDHGPAFFAGAFLPGGGFDTDHIAASIRQDIGRGLLVEQTYRSTASAGIAKIVADLDGIFQRGAIPHLYIEPAKDLSSGWPANYTRAQYETATVDTEIAGDLQKVAVKIVDALTVSPSRRLLFSFGAEMNGGWTPWGCLPAATFVALHSKMRSLLDDEMNARGVDERRVRWIYAPDSRGSSKRQDGRGNEIPGTTCNPSASAYYPGHAQIDYLGLSAYRSGEQSVDDAVITPAHKLLDDLQIAPNLREGRFIVLQTGSRDNASRPAFITKLHEQLAADTIFSGVIWFNAAQYSVIGAAGPASGYVAWRGALSAHPGRPSLLFDRYFWDVGPTHPYFDELQQLGDLGIGGCFDSPRKYCPDSVLRRAAAAVLLGKVFKIAEMPGAAVVFTDVPSTHPNFAIIAALAQRGAVTTCGSGQFCPQVAITRAELDAAIVTLGGLSHPYPMPSESSSMVSRGAGGAHLVRALH